MRKRIAGVLCGGMLALAALLPGRATADLAGADVLNASLLPASISLGGAYASLADDVTSPLVNPAGLAHVRNFQLALLHQIGVYDSVEYAAIAQPLRALGSLGLGVIYRHGLEIDNPGAVDARVRSEDLLFDLAYAFQMKFLTTQLEEWSFGAALKLLRSTLGDYQAQAAAVDAGLQWRSTAVPGWQAGLAVRNLGSGIRYIEREDPLPADVAAATDYLFFKQAEHALIGVLELDLGLTDSVLEAGAGLRYNFNDLFLVSVGYRYSPDSLTSVVTGGLGFRYRWQRFMIQADYAFRPVMFGAQDTASAHTLALSLGF